MASVTAAGGAAAFGQQPTAASAIAEHLSTPPSLNRIPLLRQRIHKERTQLQQTLSSRAKDQTDLVKQGLAGLKLARDSTEQLRDHLAEVEHLMLDPRAQVQGFGKLVEVSVVHRRLTQTLDMVSSLRSMYSRLAHLEQLLAADRADPLGPSPNLLTVHYHLTELETFRNETLAQAKKAGGGGGAVLPTGSSATATTTRETLERYFERLGETIEAFEAHYFRLASELLVLARAGHAAVAVKLAKIAQLETARDQKALAIRLVKKAGNVDVASRFRSLQADARTLKHYRQRVLDKIRESCRLQVEKSFRNADQDALRWLDQLDWLYDDILTVRELLTDKFPEDWNIEQVYVKAYHQALYDFLANLVKSGVGADTLLRLSQFPKEYVKTMTKELEIDPDWLEQPRLLDGREASLVDDYFALISQRMDEWTANLMKTEVADFCSRDHPPEVSDADGLYGMQGAVILFQMLNQQVDLALESNQAAVLARVVDEAGRVIRGVQQQWLKILDQEYRKKAATTADPADFAPGLDLYITALANDQIKSADFTEALNARLEPLVSAKYKSVIADQLNVAMDGYLDVAKRCVQILIDLVFDDLRPATKAFMTAGWYSQPGQQPGAAAMEQVVETLKDYMTDFQEQLNPNLFDLLIEDILDTFVLAYLTAIRRSSKLRIPQACERMRKDIDLAFEFFLQYKPKQELASYFDVLESVLTLMSASKMMVFLDYWPFRKKYGPALAFTEALMKARDDLDRSAVNEIMESVRRKVASEKLDEPDPPSIFDRLPPK